MFSPERIIDLLLGGLLALLAWTGVRQIRRLDKVEEAALTAASMAQVEQEIDRCITERHRELREDIREIRAILIKAVERRD